jgi:hypothetical protein
MNQLKIVVFALLALFTVTCGKEDIDDTKPEIRIDFTGAFPINCDTLYFGEPFTVVMLCADNVELGSTRAFNIDIHHNFDHHSHSTEVTECNLNEKKDPVNPYIFIQTYNLPEGVAEYQTSVELTIPDSDSKGAYDEGDYHFFVSVTDKEGWSVQMGLSIKLLRR